MNYLRLLYLPQSNIKKMLKTLKVFKSIFVQNLTKKI